MAVPLPATRHQNRSTAIPVYDGAADPVVIWNPLAEKWWMFYTNRRRERAGPAGRFLGPRHADRHRRIGRRRHDLEVRRHRGDRIAGRHDRGADLVVPDVIRGDDGQWHMFLTVVPGVFTDWNHPRNIVHYTSDDLRKWTNPRPLKLANDKVIDATVFKRPDGTWRMFYNNERDNKSIYFADSPDLNEWTDRGRAEGVGDRCEGPKVFRWRDKYWIVVDQWRAWACSARTTPNIGKPSGRIYCSSPGQGNEDQVQGQHADVVVNGDRAYLFYFTHPGRRGEERRPRRHRAAPQLDPSGGAEGEGRLAHCDRDRPTHVDLLVPPK